MKIDGIKLPYDWRDLIESLVDGDDLMMDDRSVQAALKEAGYATTSMFRRGAITGTDKLTEWWAVHKDDQPETYPSTFDEVWAQVTDELNLPMVFPAIFSEAARKVWDARGRAGQDID